MSDNTSVIDAIKLIAKATKEDSGKMSDIAKGALHADQIDDLRLMLSRARDGTVVHGAATATASSASAAAAPRETSVQRRAWKGSSNRLPQFRGAASTSESHFPPLSTAATTWRQVASRAPSRRWAETPRPTLSGRYVARGEGAK